MSASGTSMPRPAIQSASAAAQDAIRCSVLPEIVKVVTGDAESLLDTGTGSGPCSITTCAFVPPIPNDDMAARRGPSSAGHGITSVGTNSRVGDGSIAGFHCTKLRLGGICARCTDNAALMKPAIPAAASRWPKLDFTAPRAHWLSPPPY